jgi:hypothetical protein
MPKKGYIYKALRVYWCRLPNRIGGGEIEYNDDPSIPRYMYKLKINDDKGILTRWE